MRWHQYQVRWLNGDKWELIGAFQDFDVAFALTCQRARQHIQLVDVQYQGAAAVSEDVLADIGGSREQS